MGARCRPLKGKERKTSQVRMYTDQVEMLGWIARLSGTSTAAVLDNFLHFELLKKYLSIRAQAMQVKAAEDAARKELGLEPTPKLPAPNDIPGFMGKLIDDHPEHFSPPIEPDKEGVIDLTAKPGKPQKKPKKPGRGNAPQK